MSPARRDSVTAVCPNRIDLAGGTIDLYPLYLLLGQAVTVNLAVSLTSSATVTITDGDRVAIESADLGAAGDLAPGEIPPEGPLALAARAVQCFWSGGGLAVRTQNQAPHGSGLGASSALLVALAQAISALDGRSANPHQLVATLSEVEAGLLGIPTGRQDYYAALFGGLQTIEFAAGRVRRREIAWTRRLADWFGRGLVVAFTGEAHFSGQPNWEVIKAALDGDQEVRQRLAGIHRAALRAAQALADGSWEELVAAVNDDWRERSELHAEVTSPRLDALLAIARAAGGAAAKLCGAGGGGSLLVLSPPESRDAVREALSRAGAVPLDLAPDRGGCILR